MCQKNRLSRLRIDTLQILCGLLKEVVTERWKHVVEEEVQIAFLRSGYVMGGFQPTLRNVAKNCK